MFVSATVSAVVLRSLVLAVALVAPAILLRGFEQSLAYALLAGTLFVGALAIDIARCRLSAQRSGKLADRD